jgi:hypothetical protein
MATKAFQIRIKDKDILSILKTFSKMDDIAKTDMKQAANDIATVAASAVGSALQATPQGQAIARTIRVSKSSKSPVITIGGGSQKLSSGTPVVEILRGTEFGTYNNVKRERKSGSYVGLRQFKPRSPREGRGNAGYFIFPTLKALQPYITQEWVKQVDRIRQEWKSRIA